MPNKSTDTCVKMSKDLRDKLASMGKKSDTFENIIENLIEKKSCPENQESQNGDQE